LVNVTGQTASLLLPGADTPGQLRDPDRITRSVAVLAVPPGSRLLLGPHDAGRAALSCPDLAGVRRHLGQLPETWSVRPARNASGGGDGRPAADTAEPARMKAGEFRPGRSGKPVSVIGILDGQISVIRLARAGRAVSRHLTGLLAPEERRDHPCRARVTGNGFPAGTRSVIPAACRRGTRGRCRCGSAAALLPGRRAGSAAAGHSRHDGVANYIRVIHQPSQGFRQKKVDPPVTGEPHTLTPDGSGSSPAKLWPCTGCESPAKDSTVDQQYQVARPGRRCVPARRVVFVPPGIPARVPSAAAVACWRLFPARTTGRSSWGLPHVAMPGRQPGLNMRKGP
jgi:hypothetical protein